MTFISGHSAFIAWAPSAAAITESVDGITPPTIPALPTNPVLIGYTNTVPEAVRRFNSKMGYAIGTSEGVYSVRGRLENEVKFLLRLGSFGFLPNVVRRSSDDDLPQIDIFVGVKGLYTNVYRYSKCATAAFNFAESEGGGGELSVDTSFWSLLVQPGPILNPTAAQLRALGTPLMWHDVRRLSVAGVNYRQSVMSQTWNLNHNLERKHERENWGDDNVASLTPYALLPHTQTITGETRFSQQLPEALFTGAKTARDWGNMDIFASDSPAVDSGGKNYTVTAGGVMPDSSTQDGVAASAQMTNSVSVIAQSLSVSTV